MEDKITKCIGKYFFWKDDWNWVYEGIFVKSVREDDGGLLVDRFFLSEDRLFYEIDGSIYEEQEGYFEDMTKYEVSKEEYWSLVEEMTQKHYNHIKLIADGTTGAENN